MNTYLITLKNWYEQRLLRERLLFLALTWATIYAVFTLLFLNPIHNLIDDQQKTIKKSSDTISNWQIQINALKRIADTQLYKEWSSQHQSLEDIKKKYAELLQSNSIKQWQEVINLILQPQGTITLAQVNTQPQTLYQSTSPTKSNAEIYQQQISLSVYGSYFEILDYLGRMEKFLPNVHWNKLTYEVIQYPAAKVDMEFSIFYEKSS